MTRDWTNLICTSIPLTRAMQIETRVEDNGRVCLSAPLAPNVNDKGTGFGGSVATLATLCGWVEVQRQLDAAGNMGMADIVVQRGETHYLRPVTDDFSASVEVIGADEAARFLRMFQKRGLARLSLSVHVICRGELCARFSGDYVASRTAQ